MDEIKNRLSASSEACIKAYEAWRAKSTDHGAREALLEAVHELRKVGARLEIELAVSDRKAQSSDPIPIPSHRASRRQGGDYEGGDDDNRANRMPSSGGQGQAGPQRRPVHNLRRPSEGGAAPSAAPTENAGNEAAPASGGDDDARKGKPLSLRRSTAEGEQG